MPLFSTQISNTRTSRLCGAVFGIALMLLSAAGGVRGANRIAEEIQEIASHSVEAVTRTEEARAPSRESLRHVLRDVPRTAACRSCVNRGGHNDVTGHSLANGLNAPLRC